MKTIFTKPTSILISFFLFAATSFTVQAQFASSGDFKVGNLYYKITDAEMHTVNVAPQLNGENKITGSYYNTLNEPKGDIIIPAQVTNPDDNTVYQVTGVGNRVFENCKEVTSVFIPSTVTKIGWAAFANCTGLTSIDIPSNVAKLDWYAFSSCTGLTTVTIPKSLTSYGAGAFRHCSALTDFQVEAGNTFFAVEDGVLFNYDKTTLWQCPGDKEGTYSIPNSVTTLENFSLAGCEKLTTLNIPVGLTEIKEDLWTCKALTSINVANGNSQYSSQDGVLFNTSKTLLVRYPTGKTGPYTIPNTVTTIYSNAFFNCAGLTSVIIPGSINEIAYGTFSNCTALTSVTLQEGITKFCQNAFKNCIGLSSLDIPASVTQIEGYAFEGCTGFTSFTIPGNVSKTWHSIFKNCTNLTSVVISEGVQEIGKNLFEGCTSLTKAVIPNSVTNIGSQLFYNCTELKEIYSDIEEPETVTMANNVFFTVNKTTCTLYVPPGSKAKYQATAQWQDFTNIVELYPLYVAGIQVTSFNADNILGEGITGTVSYNADTKTLTLDNAEISKGKEDDISEAAIYTTNDLNILLKGNNKINLSSKKYRVGMIIENSENTFSITGQGTLEINIHNADLGFGIYGNTYFSAKSLTITNCTGGFFAKDLAIQSGTVEIESVFTNEHAAAISLTGSLSIYPNALINEGNTPPGSEVSELTMTSSKSKKYVHIRPISSGFNSQMEQNISVLGGEGVINICNLSSNSNQNKSTIIYLYNLSGVLIRSLEFTQPEAKIKIELSAGIYVVHIGNIVKTVAVR